MAMKARVANFIRTSLFNKKLENITETEKLELFNQIFEANKLMHEELNNYKSKRQYKAHIEELRKKAA